MPYQVSIDLTVNCAFIRHEGSFDLTNFANSADDRLNHPNFRKSINFLHDFTAIAIPADTDFRAIADESKRIIKEYNQRLGQCKGGVVIGDSTSYAKIHQFIEAGRFSKNPVERRVFQNFEDAKAWLEIPPEYEIKYE